MGGIYSSFSFPFSFLFFFSSLVLIFCCAACSLVGTMTSIILYQTRRVDYTLVSLFSILSFSFSFSFFSLLFCLSSPPQSTPLYFLGLYAKSTEWWSESGRS